MVPPPLVLALDVGGTKLAAALVGADGSIDRRATVPTPATGTAGQLWDAVCGLVDPLLDASPAVVGVGCGGPMERGGSTVSPLNIPAWREFPLLERLGDRCGVPVAIDNDAKALALGARLVFIGRPAMYGLACGGQVGVEKVVRHLVREIDIDLALLGCPSTAQLDRSYLSLASRL